MLEVFFLVFLVFCCYFCNVAFFFFFFWGVNGGVTVHKMSLTVRTV